jgi:hypothetical protein
MRSALRETFPNAEIVLLGRQWHKEYVEERPGAVDRVVVVPAYPVSATHHLLQR